MSYSVSLSAYHVNPDLKKLKVGLSRGKNFIYDFVPQDELHITICQTEKPDDIIAKIPEILAGVSPLTLKLSGIDAYPDAKEARLLWIGVQNTKEIRELRTKILKGMGIELESDDFKPILPVVRLKNHRAVTDVISPFRNTDFGKVIFSEISVMEMISHGAFPSFRKIHSINLGDS